MTNDNHAGKKGADLTRNTPVPGHESYGGGSLDDVAGGPAGRGNDKGATPDPDRGWGRKPGQESEELPVADNDRKNPFAGDGD